MNLHLTYTPTLPGLPVLAEAFPDRITSLGTPVVFTDGRERPGFSIGQEEKSIRVSFSHPCDAYRAVGLLLAGGASPGSSQDRAHESVGVMWDLSRNGVLRMEAWEEILRKFALLGINSVQLYMEDVYEIPGEPFFGYGRGGYSADELRRIDDYGHRLGIEIVPCIQTLGHLGQILRWPAYSDLADVPGVLMVGEKKTQELIGRMLDQMSACFRSRTLHIGMDEAHGVGTGNYLTRNGYQRAFDILIRHLETVVEMCRARGLHPMMWSDMFFRIGSQRHDYYDREAVVPSEVACRIPPGVELVYWDYYHADPGFYEEWIKRHRALGKEPIFAAGAWNWGRFWAYAPRWRESLSAGMKTAREQKLAQTFLTIWGDDGDEFHPASVLPAIQYFAQWAYAGEPDDQALQRQFTVISPGSSLPAYLAASQLDEIPALRDSRECTANPSKWILWHDPVIGFLNAHLTPDLPAHYSKLAKALEQPDADEAIRFAAKVARAVGLKAQLHLKTRAAWKTKDSGEIRRLRTEVLPQCLDAVNDLWNAHRAVWRQWKKPFGWEVIELRYAGVTARLKSLETLLDECLANPQLHVPEWTNPPLRIREQVSEVYFNYDKTATPSIVK